MPRNKRPLSEVNPNASTASRKSAKLDNCQPFEQKQENGERNAASKANTQRLPSLLARFTKLSAPGTVFRGTNFEEAEEEQDLREEEFKYENKDNSKLRRFLSERSLSTSGIREELIARLQKSSIDYESLPSAKLTEMLKERHVTSSAQGNKQYKIERLRINDKIERDTGTSKESYLYGTMSAREMILKESLKVKDEDYSTLKPARLSTLLEKKRLAKSGSKDVMIRRLQKHDRKSKEKKIISIQNSLERSICDVVQ